MGEEIRVFERKEGVDIFVFEIEDLQSIYVLSDL